MITAAITELAGNLWVAAVAGGALYGLSRPAGRSK